MVYTIRDGIVVEQFEADYNFAIGEYWGKSNSKGTYYIAKKGVKIPYSQKKRILKNVHRQQVDDQEQSS